MMSKRNQPCHCGSGRKAKKCCLGYILPPPLPPATPEEVERAKKFLDDLESTMATIMVYGEPKWTRTTAK